jgi:glycosyltransferase involved in cell wall biosynthesis
MEHDTIADSSSRLVIQRQEPMPHVLVVSNHLDVKTRLPFAGVFVDRQVASLRSIGLTVTVFDIGARYNPLIIAKTWYELLREVQRLKPDLIHARYGTLVGILAVLVNRPTVITFCGSDLNPGASVSSLRMRLGFLLSNLAALRARKIICVSEGLRQALWWRRDRVVVIPDGVDVQIFSPGDRQEARRKLGWDLERPVVLFNLGDDRKKKGHDLAYATMDVLRALLPDSELQAVQHVAPDLMPLYYRAADVLLCTSMCEGSPNVVKEALACNLPVVSVPVGDVEERLAGVWPSAVVPRDPKLIGEELAKILLSNERSNGREHVAQIALDPVARRVTGVYRSVLQSVE